jgi:hypothetical protein
MNTIKLATIKPNPDNPRVIKDAAFYKLVDSIKQYPHFLDKRGIVHADGVILGGNMRYRAIRDALTDADFRAKIGVKTQTDIPASWVQDASAWSEADRRAFVICDNAQMGEWDWDMLANEWEVPELEAWCLELPPMDEGEGEGGESETKKDTGKKCPNCGYGIK